GVAEDRPVGRAPKQHGHAACRVICHGVVIARRGTAGRPLRPDAAVPLPGVAELASVVTAEQHGHAARRVVSHGVGIAPGWPAGRAQRPGAAVPLPRLTLYTKTTEQYGHAPCGVVGHGVVIAWRR